MNDDDNDNAKDDDNETKPGTPIFFPLTAPALLSYDTRSARRILIHPPLRRLLLLLPLLVS